MSVDKSKNPSAQKKLMDDKLKKANASEKALKASMKDYEEARKDSIKAISEFETSQQFEMSGECEDKDGALTKVLIVDTDRAGILALMVRLGNPYSIEPDKEGLVVDKDMLFTYLGAMSNIEFTDDNLSSIGRKAILAARSMVANFFTLLVVSELPEVKETGS